MCEKLDTIKFCSCNADIDLNKSNNDSNYIWILERVVGLDRSGLIGLTMLPTKQLDELVPEFIVQKLNSENLFDFEYEPKENDSLRIERIDRSKTKHKEYLFGQYLDFHYFKGKWYIGGVNPFMYNLENYKNGKVKLVK
jgi:hypothetical protein